MKKVLIHIISLMVLVLFAVTTSHAQGQLKGAAADIDKGWQKMDIPLLEKTVNSLEDTAKKNPKDHLASYYAAKAHFALADCFDIKSSKEFDDTGKGDKHIDSALDMIKTSLAAKDSSADTYILKFQVIRRKMFRVGFPMLMMHVANRKGAYEKAKELAPNNLTVQLLSAIEAAEGGWPPPPPEKAVLDFQKLLSKSPKVADAYYEIGSIWEKAKKTADAKKNYNKALEVDPNHHWAKKKLKGLAGGTGA